MFEFEYRKLGDFTYNILSHKEDIYPFLLQWIGQEWQTDHEEAPDQVWTIEWLKLLPQMTYSLEILDLKAIKPRVDLMSHQTESYSFIEELSERAQEREISMLRGVSIEPLLVNEDGPELMDGYTRYQVLQKYGQEKVYAYVGHLSGR